MQDAFQNEKDVTQGRPVGFGYITTPRPEYRCLRSFASPGYCLAIQSVPVVPCTAATVATRLI